jgi:NADH/F420H2 dehydrogenase subunit C
MGVIGKSMVEPNKVIKREREIPTVPVNLDVIGEKLISFLEKESFQIFDALISVEADMVTINIDKEKLVETAIYLKSTGELQFDYLSCITVVDYIASDNNYEIVYHLISLTHQFKMAIKCILTEENMTIPTLYDVWRSADWFERESHDLFGVFFQGHPNLSPLLLYEGFEGFPGRKSFPFHDYEEW